MNEGDSFGRRASRLSSAASLVELEATVDKGEVFADIDAVIAHVVNRALSGESALELKRGRRVDSLSVVGLDQRLRAILDDQFSVTNQKSRGAWFLPEKASLRTGMVSLPAFFAKHSRFAMGLASEERARVLLADEAANVLVWAVVQPLVDQLFLPFELRGPLAGTKGRDDQLPAWASFDDLVSALGFRIEDEIAVMRYGGGWEALRAPEQLAVKQRLLAALAAQVNAQTATLYRAYRLLPLIARYYEKAKNGQAKRKQVLTRPLEATLSGFFGGDWLRFLRYLDESPHRDEQLETSLPETALFMSAAGSGAAVATTVGESPSAEDARRVLDDRVRVLKTFWAHFDEIHSKQASGMRSLWGLVAENRGVRLGWSGPAWHSSELYRTQLPSDILSEIDRCWGSTMLSRWPDRIVDEISPHALMAETVGVALQFWQGIALTAWFVCEGPMSRTDIPGLATYYEDAVAELEMLGSPVDTALFQDLRRAEAQLGSPESLYETKSSVELAPDFGIDISMRTGSRRSGFEVLRDIITRYRRAWTEQYLDNYLQARWEGEVGEAARRHAEAAADRGKPPTPKQFAKHALTATNHWFGGDLRMFYMAIGQKPLISPARISIMPLDRLGFVKIVFDHLKEYSLHEPTPIRNQQARQDQAEERNMLNQLEWLAEESLRFVQLQEALGRIPDLKDFGAAGFKSRSIVLSSDPVVAWSNYASAVTAALGHTTVTANGPASHSAAPSPTTPVRLPEPPTQPEEPTAPGGWVNRLLGRSN